MVAMRHRGGESASLIEHDDPAVAECFDSFGAASRTPCSGFGGPRGAGSWPWLSANTGSKLQPASQPQRRPTPPWLLLTGFLVAVALVSGVLVGAVAWSDDRPASSRTAGGVSSATQRPNTIAGPMASAACKTPVDRANAMLASAVKLRRVMAEQDRILRDPANRRLSGPRCSKGRSGLRAGSSDSARFNRALDAYRQVVDQWRPAGP
jgi:hypothetical protein